MIKLNCKFCGKEFLTFPCLIKAGRRYCSKECTDKDKIGQRSKKYSGIKAICLECKREFTTFPYLIAIGKGKMCSKECKDTHSIGNFSGNKNPKWRGGKSVMGIGYVGILSPDHPYADRHGYMMEHRLVIEKHLGRFLTPKEIVHHMNHNRSDNRLENLMVMSNGEHISFHLKEQWGPTGCRRSADSVAQNLSGTKK